MSEPILLQRHQIDDTAWNALIDEARHSVVYAYTWYLDCVSPGWQALVLVESGELIVDSALASDPTGTSSSNHSLVDYNLVMPLPVRKKWGMNVIQQPLFCQYLGLFSKNEISESDLLRFLHSLNLHFPYISVYDFHPSHTYLLRSVLPACPDFEVQEKTTHWLNLEKTYPELALDYSADRRKNLARSKKYGWECVQSTDLEPLISLFQENHASRIGNVQASAYTLLRKLTLLLQKKGIACVYYARRQGILHAGIMVLERNETGIYIFNAADEAGRRGNARSFLLDRYFQKKAGRLKIFDFESPEVESIAQFYYSFGAGKQPFISIKKNKLPFPLRQLQAWRKAWLTAT